MSKKIYHVENPVTEVHDLTVTYDRKPVLWDIDLSLPKGAVVGIMGPNGAGKSTLIKAMMGLLPMASGYVKMFDKKLDEVRDRISYVPQRGTVDWDFPALVKDVVLMGRYAKIGLFSRARKADLDIAMECLHKVNMENFAHRQISQLSGGQQQRVFLARALAQHADLYFMDEPFVGVDMATEKAIVELMQEMTKKGKTVIVVHHDLQTAQKYFDWIILLNTRLVASGPTKSVLTNEIVAETYGGNLSLLTDLSQELKNQAFPNREN
ncbi:metal ABC transporter ATP-binding protein [Persicobacter psychrovividus]|uniref:Manganese transport system ATP-binding protein MntB n=1 Tax=Persicobacter psychrovividus TaxID=387638 RepID=A0ABM7VD93_9BACT|nr:manganese transport system ATP-binding protein MntB [Persicobacter psychrovividus]